jgi:hypothetical protein
VRLLGVLFAATAAAAVAAGLLRGQLCGAARSVDEGSLSSMIAPPSSYQRFENRNHKERKQKRLYVPTRAGRDTFAVPIVVIAVRRTTVPKNNKRKKEQPTQKKQA